MIRVVCGCGRVFKAEERHSGKRTRCPVCGASLIIGDTPASDSSGGDLDELPSWWYPSDPHGMDGMDRAAPPGAGDTEAVRTKVIEPRIGADPGAPAGPKDDRPVSRASPSRGGGLLWTVVGCAAALALLVLGMLWWRILPAPGPVEALAGPTPRDGAAARNDPRIGPGPGVVAARGPAQAGDEGRTRRPAHRLHLLVPAYIYPNPEGRKQWERLMEAASKVDLVAVVNCDSGPGHEPNPLYSSLTTEAARRGITLIGYVSVRYGERPAAEVKAEIDAWVRFYPSISGYFLDQQPRDARHAAYLADISTYARGKVRGALIVTDPGSPCDESYLARRASDVVCVFASSGGLAPLDMPPELKAYDPSHFAADGNGPNPWDRLPAYWEVEVDAVARLQ